MQPSGILKLLAQCPLQSRLRAPRRASTPPVFLLAAATSKQLSVGTTASQAHAIHDGRLTWATRRSAATAQRQPARSKIAARALLRTIDHDSADKVC